MLNLHSSCRRRLAGNSGMPPFRRRYVFLLLLGPFDHDDFCENAGARASCPHCQTLTFSSFAVILRSSLFV
ncbi:MAG: hypothetical protein C4527_18475 [Candidatus Omnitrophota bacterium]|nr:MAG: hypothetical protein C4527_18475 [Candidatus Omnitrophota bacterium]